MAKAQRQNLADEKMFANIERGEGDPFKDRKPQKHKVPDFTKGYHAEREIQLRKKEVLKKLRIDRENKELGKKLTTNELRLRSKRKKTVSQI